MSRKSHAHHPPAKPKRSRKKRPAKSRWRTASTSDIHDLYERSVQEPEAESDLVDQVWKEIRGRKPHHIREDFCGTAAVCMDWVKRRPSNTAEGVDLDQDVLDWGLVRSLKLLKPSQRRRMKLVRGDVRTARTRPVDSVLAMNFSYMVFKTRAELLVYFKNSRRRLVKDGLFLLDAYGGSESYLEIEEDRNLDGFTYVWDQRHFNPINNHVINHIHFRFPDDTKISKAFTYDWRLWSLPELRDVLIDAGFKDVAIYWEGTVQRTGEGNGVWTRSTQGEACQGWIAYVVGIK
jgi:hypothetical protein